MWFSLSAPNSGDGFEFGEPYIFFFDRDLKTSPFLTCLNRVALHANDQDDLVTLLWERDFHGIRYFAVEELATTALFPRLEEQLASGELSCGGAEEAEAMSLDLDQPVSSVPVETCRLDEGEIEALQAELVRESAIPFETLVTELAIELTLLKENEAERDELIESLVRISDRLISEGALGELAAMGRAYGRASRRWRSKTTWRSNGLLRRF